MPTNGPLPQPSTQTGTGGERVKAGDPILNYYPAAVDEPTFLSAQTSIGQRKRVGQGRRGKHINLFAGLLHDVRDGGSVCYSHAARRSFLMNLNGRMGLISHMPTFPAMVSEQALVAALAEIDPADVFPPTDDRVSDRAADEGRLVELERQIATIVDALGGFDLPAIVQNIKTLELERAEVSDRLNKRRQEAFTPVGDAWELLRTPPTKPEERFRLQNAIRRLVSRVDVLMVRDGRRSMAAADVKFAGHRAGRRTVLVKHRSRWRNRPKWSFWETRKAEWIPAYGEAGGHFDFNYDYDLDKMTHLMEQQCEADYWNEVERG